MRLGFGLLVCLILALGLQVTAQDDVIQVEYDEIEEIDIERGRNEFFLEFEAEAGDVVYLLTGVQELTFEDEVELEFRDADGRGIGFTGEIILDPFAVAVIEEDGTYTAVIDYRAEEDNVLEAIVGLTSLIGPDPVTIEIGENAFVDLALINVEDDGEYVFTMTREDGDLTPAMTILDFSTSYPTRIVDMSGAGLISGSATIELEEGEDYLVMIGQNTIMTHSYFPPVDEAEMTLSLVPAD